MLIFPILILFVFKQWSTHPYGVIFFSPIFSLFIGALFYEGFKKNLLLAFLLIILIFFLGTYFSVKGLSNFYRFLILGPKDINVLKELKNQVKDDEVCLGQNQMGLYCGGIAMWYLRKNIQFSPKCLEDENKLKNLKLAIVFHPQLGQFYLNETNNFLNKNFKPLGCAELWCILQK